MGSRVVLKVEIFTRLERDHQLYPALTRFCRTTAITTGQTTALQTWGDGHLESYAELDTKTWTTNENRFKYASSRHGVLPCRLTLVVYPCS